MADLAHDTLGPNIIAACFVTWTVALIFVLLRFWTRARIVHALGMADWFIALSLLAAGGMCISNVIQVKYGMGKHVWDFDFPNGFSPMMEAWWFSLLLYVVSLSLTKTSICLLYLTIFTFEWARRASYAVLTVVVITSLWAVATTLTYCIPLQATWDPTVVASFCQGQDAWWANTGIIIVTDLMIFILPIPFILPLKLPRRQKLVVVGIFAIGFFVCIVSLVRLVILVGVKNSTNPDFTYTPATLTYLTVLEVHTAIVVACAMTLKPLVTRFFPRLFAPGYTGQSSTAGGGAGVRGGGGSSSPNRAAERSAASSEPPLTIGSRPSRLKPLPGQEESGLGGITMGDGDVKTGHGVVPGDVEQAAGYGRGEREMGEKEEVERSAGGAAPDGEMRSVHGTGAGPWMKSDAWSERTEDLGREATARSVG